MSRPNPLIRGKIIRTGPNIIYVGRRSWLTFPTANGNHSQFHMPADFLEVENERE
jgi:hypothetical protein